MEEIHLVEFDPASPHYSCRTCMTPIVLLENCSHAVVHGWDRKVVAENPENLMNITQEDIYGAPDLRLASAACAGCNIVLGRKCITIPADYRGYVFQEGKFTFFLRDLLFRDGIQMLDANTLLPFEEW